MHYTFLLSVLYDSHFEKRISNLKKTGIGLQVLGFERNHYQGSSVANNVTSLGFVEHGKYLKRFPTFLKSLFTVRKKINNTDVIYCFNIETLLIGWLVSMTRWEKYKIVYDVADIREILIEKKIISAILRTIERFLIKRTNIVVVTAPDYINGYFHDYLKLHDTQYYVIENKVDSQSIQMNGHSAIQYNNDSDIIKIGYFGVIRCNHSLQLLKKVIDRSNGKIRLYIRGIFQDHLGLEKDELLNSDYVEFGGEFVSPDDLTEIYGKVDLSWTAIYHFKPNVMWSRTNRFYQACFFKKPMITQQGTPDAAQVKKYDIGFSIDLTKQSEALNEILSISQIQIYQWTENMKKMPEDVYVLTDEHEELVSKLKIFN